MIKTLFTILLILSGVAISAQRLSDVPGQVVYWRISPATLFGYALSPNRIYTASPSIVKLPNGEYLLSFNLFGSDMSPATDVSGTTYLYKSADKGNTWTPLPGSPMMDMKRGSLFVQDGIVYIWGYRAAPGQIIIRKSTDNGLTWSTETQLTTNKHGGTPFNPVFMPDHNGVNRVWCAVAGKSLMSGRPDATLIMNASNWTGVGADTNTNNQPVFGSGVSVAVISEAQIVSSPQTGLVVMPKVQMDGVSAPYFSYTVLLKRNPTSNNNLQTATKENWVALPGAEKKFAASYDPVSQKFYVLSNPVLPAHESGSGFTWQLIRNTGALISSRDLYHWDVEQLFLYSGNINYEGFQYFNFDYDGDDMIVASRTAFDITGESGVNNKPPRGHDSNMITFHKISNFREASPDFFLTFNGNKVFRHEQTQHAAAPLGSFVLGTVFDGQALGTVNGFAQDVDGDVYVREQSGRVLRFDALGNFKETVANAPVALVQSGQLTVKPPALGERTYIKSDNGNWNDLFNWFYWGRPDTDYEIANLGSAITSNSVLTLDKSYTLKGIRFRSAYEYNLTGSGSIDIKSDSGNGIMEAQKGSHNINVPVKLESNTVTTTAKESTISLKSGINLNGKDLHIKGTGQFEIGGNFVMNDGMIISDGLSQLHFTSTVSTNLNGKLKFEPDAGLMLAKDAVFQLIEGVENLQGTFSELILPELSAELAWDLSALYTQGKIIIVENTEISGEKSIDVHGTDIILTLNPLLKELVIDFKGNNHKVSIAIFNVKGQLVFKDEMIEKATINTTKFNPGVYFIHLVTELTIESAKFIIN